MSHGAKANNPCKPGRFREIRQPALALVNRGPKFFSEIQKKSVDKAQAR